MISIGINVAFRHSKKGEGSTFADEGIMTFYKDEHWQNAEFLIFSNDEGISKVISYNDEHLVEGQITEEGIDICVNDEHLLNTDFLIIFNRECFSKVICFNEVHWSKTRVSISTTEEGISNDSNDEQLAKANFSIEVTEEGIVNCVNDWQSLKA